MLAESQAQPMLFVVPSYREDSAIAALLAKMRFCDFKLESTQLGMRRVRHAYVYGPTGEAFWSSWGDHCDAWLSRGYFGSRSAGGTRVSQWLAADGTVTAEALAKAEAFRRKKQAVDLPADWIPLDTTLETPQAALLYDWQRPGALRLKRALSLGNALDASDTGTGKTRIALTAAAELGLKPYVVCPLAVVEAWKREAEAVGVEIGWVLNYEAVRYGNSVAGVWEKACLYRAKAKGEIFRYRDLPTNAVLVYDEVQKSKGSNSQQGQLLRDAAKAKLKILGLSATAAKDPTEMRNLGAALGLHDGSYMGHRAFCLEYGCKPRGRGLRFDGKTKWLEKIHKRIFPLKGNRIRVCDVPNFPKTTITAELLAADTQAIANAYAEMDLRLQEIDADASLNNSQRASNALAEQMRARQASEMGKLKLFAEMTGDALEEGRSVIVFLNFRASIETVCASLETQCVVWGDQSAAERQTNVDAFQANRERVIVVSLQAGGAGLSLHDVHGGHPRLSLISPSYSPFDLKQSLGRPWRANAKTPCFQKIIFAAGTIEESICRSVRQKLSNIDALNDGDLAPPSFLRFTSNPQPVTHRAAQKE